MSKTYSRMYLDNVYSFDTAPHLTCASALSRFAGTTASPFQPAISNLLLSKKRAHHQSRRRITPRTRTGLLPVARTIMYGYVLAFFPAG